VKEHRQRTAGVKSKTSRRLGLGQSSVNGGARLRQCGAAEEERLQWCARRGEAAVARATEEEQLRRRARLRLSRRRGTAWLRRSSGCSSVAWLLEVTRWRMGEREAREVMEARRSSGLGLGFTAAAAEGKRKRKNRSGRTVKRAQIRFSRGDRTRWSPNQTRCSSVRSESSKLLARSDASG
jgi:hypothetical protein